MKCYKYKNRQVFIIVNYCHLRLVIFSFLFTYWDFAVKI